MVETHLPGTTYEKKRGKWKGQVRKNGKTKSLGYFATQQEAYEAVMQAKAEIGSDSEQREITATVLPSYRSDIHDSRKVETVAQSNVLIESPWAMTLLEARIFVLLLRGLRRDETESKRIVVPLVDLVGDQPIGGRGYKLLHAALDGLDAIRLELPMPNRQNDYHKVPLVHSLKLDSGNGSLSGFFSVDVLPHLTNLVDNFTLGQVADLMSIRSPNTHKFYWIMQMWKYKSPHTVDVELLRELTTGKLAYPQFSDYRKHVLKPSVDELNSLNFDISYTENKVGRTVDSIEFFIKYNVSSKRPPRQLQLQLGEKNTADLNSLKGTTNTAERSEAQGRVAKRMRKFRLEEYQIDRILTLSEDELRKLMKDTHPLLVEYEAGTKSFDNIAATAMSRINQLFPRLYPKAK